MLVIFALETKQTTTFAVFDYKIFVMFTIDFYVFKHRYPKFVCDNEKDVLKALKDFRACGKGLFMHKSIAGSYAIVSYTVSI